MNKVFISYSHKDEALKDQALVHLGALESKFGLDVWSDEKIDLGDKWLAEIDAKLSRTVSAPATAIATGLAPDQITLAKLPITGPDLFGRERELEMLDRAWAQPHTNIFSLVAWGGVGKTALVNHWLNGMARDNYRGAERVYGWSFYSQGTKEDRQVSADEFFADALAWFGYGGPPILSPWDKGKKLAELIEELGYHRRDQEVQELRGEVAKSN